MFTIYCSRAEFFKLGFLARRFRRFTPGRVETSSVPGQSPPKVPATAKKAPRSLRAAPRRAALPPPRGACAGQLRPETSAGSGGGPGRLSLCCAPRLTPRPPVARRTGNTEAAAAAPAPPRPRPTRGAPRPPVFPSDRRPVEAAGGPCQPAHAERPSPGGPRTSRAPRGTVAVAIAVTAAPGPDPRKASPGVPAPFLGPERRVLSREGPRAPFARGLGVLARSPRRGSLRPAGASRSPRRGARAPRGRLPQAGSGQPSPEPLLFLL